MVFATACQAHMAGTKSAIHAIFMMVSMGDLVSSVRASAARLGIFPVDLLTAMSYETGGKLDPLDSSVHIAIPYLRCWPVQTLSRTCGGMDRTSLPQFFRDRKRGDLHVRPPVCFVTLTV